MKNPFRKGKVLASTFLAVALFAGCGDSESFVFTNTNNPVVPPALQAPVAVNDAFPALGNATLQQAATGVLANDTINGATITSFDATGSNGGTLDLNADGSFTYTPATGFVGQETFAYTLSNADGQSTATITLTSTGFGRFVDNSGANGTGTQASPFNNLAAAVTAAQPGDTIYVSRGDGTNTGMTGGFILPAGVNLIGEGTGLILSQTIEPAGPAPTIEGPIDCRGDNLIQGVTIDGSSGELVQIDTVGNVTINQCTLLNPANSEEHVRADEVSGTFTVTNCSFGLDPGNTGDDYIYVENEDVNTTIVVTDNTFTNEANSSLDTIVEIYGEGTMTIDATISRNNFNGTVGGELDYGIYYDCEDEPNVTATVTCEDNTFANHDEDVISVFDCSGVISGNTITNTDDTDAIYVSVANNLLTISGNVISNVGCGIYGYYNEDGASGTIVASNNNITNSSDDGIYITDDSDDNDAHFAARGNTVTGSTNASIEISWDHDTDICAEITGNTVDTDMELDGGSGTGDLDIERRDQLTTINTFNSGATVVLSGNTNDVAQGACAIP